MTDEDPATQAEPDFEDWVKEADGSVRLWPMQGFSCRAVRQGVSAMRIDFLYPPGYGPRTGKLQVHMSRQQARLLASALLSAAKALD